MADTKQLLVASNVFIGSGSGDRVLKMDPLIAAKRNDSFERRLLPSAGVLVSIEFILSGIKYLNGIKLRRIDLENGAVCERERRELYC